MTMNERLLRSWLHLSYSVCNRKFLSVLSLSEAVVCNLILERDEKGALVSYTATDLCRRMGMLKSQMNKTLTALEKRGLIERVRSQEDRRCVRIVPRTDHLDEYYKEHAQVLDVVAQVTGLLGAEKSERLTDDLENLARCVDKVIGKE